MQMEMMFVAEVTVRVWSGIERLNLLRPVGYVAWLRFHDGLGNGGEL